MPATIEKTVREIAMQDPSSIRVFESLGIDYCCGGKRPLSEACSHANADVDRVRELLEEASRAARVQPGEEWAGKKLGELIACIVATHHAYVRHEAPRLETLLAKVVSRHGAAHPEVARIAELFSAIDRELSTHLMKEEQVLFPHIERMEEALATGESAPVPFFGTIQRPVAMMIAEHDDAGALLARIRELSGGYSAPAGACPSFVALYQGLEEFERDLHRHVHLENNILFPRAVEMERGC